MKNLVVLSGLIAAASAGCIISSDSGSTPHVGATWQIKSFDGTVLGCPNGFDTAALYNQPLDQNNQPVGSPIIDLFDCAADAGRSAPLPATAYETHVEITNHDNSLVYAKSVPAFLDITDVDMTYNTDIYDDAGYFMLQWNLVGASNNAPLDCASAGITGSSSGVETTATISGPGTAFTDQFNCEDGFGFTSALPAGTYTVSVDAFTSAGGAGQAVNLANKVIKDRTQDPDPVTNLGTVTLPIDGH